MRTNVQVRVWPWLLGVVTMSQAACGGDAGSDYVIEVGQAAYIDGNPAIQSPPSAVVGEQFTVSITTVGGSCVLFDSTSVALHETSAIIVPYDRRREASEEQPCLLLAVPLVHEAALIFHESGPKTIRFHSRRVIGPPPNDYEELYEIPVSVSVQ